ncbi:MFS transporter [Kutzneria buriramensis]|uniref:Putative MFS family arabinose efflux permease n=1 Tax=Kutzneria buriramensis TaxID=1045776 RepID=A0A3E0GVE1_9PSEU|nr:MFS transporter [Kutzneria buriramensis]REH29646.1 putative MFS family arabinose efflux permease [Kutzneria buriramensis]
MTAATAPREETVSRAPSAPWLALLAGPLSFGIAAPALILSRVAGDLGVSVAAATWIVTGFGLGIAVGTPLLAGLIGHRGVRAALTTSAGLVLLGVVLAVAVPSLPVLAAAGVIQGLGSAGLTAIAMNLAKSPRVMGLVTAALAVFGATAPLVGSLLSDAVSWQATLALPGVSLLAVPACLRFAPTAPTAREGFDGRGAVLLTAVVTALVFVPQWPVVAGACVVAFGVLLGFHLRMRPNGFVPTVLLRTPRFLISSGLAFALAVVNFGMFYGVPIQLAKHAGWSASQIGIAMLWPLLLGGTVSWVVVTATARLRMGVVLTGFIAAGVTAALLGLTSVNPVVLLVAPGISALTAASGQGVFAVRATAAVPDERRSAAIGLFTLCYLLGAAFGPAIVALLAG